MYDIHLNGPYDLLHVGACAAGRSVTETQLSCERAAPCVQEGCGGRRGATDVVPSRNNLGEICKCIFYGDGGDRYWWQPRIDKSRVVGQNLSREQGNVPSLRPRRFSP